MTQLIKLNSWIGEVRANVVFVHGLMGHAYNTWRRGNEIDAIQDPTFWPLWLARDINGIETYTISYDAPASNWLGTTMSLEDRAANVLDRLLAEPALSQKNTTFICHSLGGLLVKQIILDLKAQEDRRPEAALLLKHIKQVIFVATPHIGSSHASWLERLKFLAWPTAISKNLMANDPALRKINVYYRGLADELRTTLEQKIYFETQRTSAGMIVDQGSSDPGLHSDPIPIDANHITIVKPSDRKSQLYIGVYEFIQRYPKLDKSDGKLEILPTETILVERSWNFIPKLVRIGMLIIFSFGFFGLFKPDHFPHPATGSEEAIIDKYFSLIDSGNVKESWNEYEDVARITVWGTFENFSTIVSNYRNPLGQVDSRIFSGYSEMQSPPGAPKGLYMLKAYKTKFSNVADCRVEQIILHTYKDGAWKLYSHQIAPISIEC